MEILQYPFDAAYVLQKKRALKKELLKKQGLLEKKVAIVSGSTVGEFKNILELFLLNAGIRPTFYEGEYALFYENVVFDDGALADFAPDVLYIHTSSRNLKNWPTPQDSEASAREKCKAEYQHFEAVWQAAKKWGCPVVQNNFELPRWRNFGNMDAWDRRGRVNHVRQLNEKLAQFARENPFLYIHDLDYLASTFGLDAWCDDATWYAYKYACAVQHIPHFCHSLSALLKSLFGLSKKAAVLDLDNTLWGGVIGEEGPEGIELGDETPRGMAFSEFQSYLKMLSSRGVLLNVASKNEENAALSGFLREDSPLRREDFLCFEANWGPKSESIAKMAKEINILPDSFVFLDDNPAERALVGRDLPMVNAPVIDEVENSIRKVDRGAYFEVTAVSEDDRKRGEMYRQNAQRQQEQGEFGSYEAYLQSLVMQAEIGPVSQDRIERVSQLINKTNQFNLTTRRYSAAEVEALASQENTLLFCGRLSDRFGDNGITSAMVVPIKGDMANIELWVMSCRVFKRHLEYAMFDALVVALKERGVKVLHGSWLKTTKNMLVREFYDSLGFELEREEADSRHYRYRIPSEYTPKNTVIQML